MGNAPTRSPDPAYRQAVEHFEKCKAVFEQQGEDAQKKLGIRHEIAMKGAAVAQFIVWGDYEAVGLNEFIQKAQKNQFEYDVLSYAFAYLTATVPDKDNPLIDWWQTTEQIDHERPTGRYPSVKVLARNNSIRQSFFDVPIKSLSRTDKVAAMAEGWGQSASNINSILRPLFAIGRAPRSITQKVPKKVK